VNEKFCQYIGSKWRKNAISNTGSSFRARVPLIMSGPRGWMPARNGLGCGIGEFVTNAFALDGEVEEGLSTEISLVLDYWDNNRTFGCTVEAFEYRVVKSFQGSGSDAGVPKNFGDKPHNGHNDTRVHRHLEHPCDTVRTQHVATPVGTRLARQTCPTHRVHQTLVSDGSR